MTDSQLLEANLKSVRFFDILVATIEGLECE